MIDAYAIGVKLALGGNVAKIVGQVADQFLALDKVINTARASVRELGSAMAGLTAEGRMAATAWREAAASMKEAARAAAGARVATGGRSATTMGAAVAAAAGGASNYPALGYSPRGKQPSAPIPPIPLNYFGRGVVPYGRGQSTVAPYQPYGPEGRWGRLYEGEVIPPGGSFVGGVPAPRGPTINGTAWQPGTASYGPYGGGYGMAGGGGSYGGGGGMPAPYAGWNGKPIPLSPIGGGRGKSGFSVGMGAAIPAWMGGEFLKDIFEHAASFDAIKSGLLAQGFSAEQVAQAEKASYATQRDVIGTSAKANLGIASMLMAVVQDPKEALALMPQYAKLGVLLNASGHGGESSEIMNAIRAGEFRGVLTKRNPDGTSEVNTEGLSHFLKEMVATSIYTHGQVGPTQLLGYLRSAGSAGALISDQELFGRTVALQMAVGNRKAGSALQGFEQQFTAGRMSEATANMLIQMGIIHGGGTAKHNPYLRKSGMGQFLMLPNAMGADAFKEAMNSPVLFTMDKLYPKLQEILRQKFGKDYDKADTQTKLGMETAMATQIASRIPGGTELAEIIRNVLLIGRDVGAFNSAMGRDAYDIALQNNPMLRQQALAASLDAFETALGNTAMVPAIHALDYLTGALNHLTDWAQKNPNTVKIALEGLTGAVISLGTGATISALGALGGPAGKLAAVGAGALILSGNIDVLAKAMSSVPRWLVDIGVGAAVGSKFGVPGALIGGMIGGATASGQSVQDTRNFVNSHNADAAATSHWLYNHTGGLMGAPGDQSFAPPSGSTGPYQPLGPVPVRVTNPNDLTRGVAGGIANQSNRPASGYTGVDPTVDPGNAFYGVLPP